ncbi:hypothetical protein KFE25_008072 [Diacronema lutheri]|uniref:AAA+ ATPase domain-containing protein n=1 Tax=Diacronema lutheri TaxID=2081491 RepID=A0A8J5XKY1_DIALT|nr:hypothetical protein KFE25_008072 [Diacronema lutheri]
MDDDVADEEAYEEACFLADEEAMRAGEVGALAHRGPLASPRAEPARARDAPARAPEPADGEADVADEEAYEEACSLADEEAMRAGEEDALAHRAPPASPRAELARAPEPAGGEAGSAGEPSAAAASSFRRPCQAAAVFSAYNGEGELVFVQTKTASAPRRIQPRHGEMLATPIHVLLAKVAAAEARADAARAAAEPPPSPSPARAAKRAHSPGGTRSPSGARAPVASADLWACKYAPRRFTQLVSDERVNRAVLHWVKSWDALVFGGRGATAAAPRCAAPGAAPSAAALSTRAWAVGGGAAHGGHGGGAAAPADGPPTRVLLLWGAPGLGKTTLAHVVARSAGYTPVEVNASDERSAGAMRRISEAMQTMSLFGDRRPKLLILDEIDGALGGSEGASAIGALLKMLAPAGGASAPDAHGGGAGRRGGASVGLQRPVICVANDAFAPALRPLRAVAEVVEMGAVSTAKLQSRLAQICEAERVAVTREALGAVIGVQQGDVRSCLHALQLLARRRGTDAPLLPADVRASGVGVRDGGCDELALLSRLLCKPAPSVGSATARAAAAAAEADLHRLLGRCDVGRMLDGALEHHAAISAIDTGMQRAERMGEWLSWAAALTDASAGRDGAGAAFGVGQAYASWAGRALRAACAVPRLGPRAVRFPRAAVDARQRATRAERALALVRAGLAPALARAFPARALRLELVESLLVACAPPLRAVPYHAMTADERDAVAQLVDTMLAAGLTMRQTRNVSGGVEFQLEPPLVELLLEPSADAAAAAADGSSDRPLAGVQPITGGRAGQDGATEPAPRCARHKPLPYTLASIVCTELGRERIRRLHVTPAAGAARRAQAGAAQPSPAARVRDAYRDAVAPAAPPGDAAADAAADADAMDVDGGRPSPAPVEVRPLPSALARPAPLAASGAGAAPHLRAEPAPTKPTPRALPMVSIATWASFKAKERADPATGSKRGAAEAAISGGENGGKQAAPRRAAAMATPDVRYKHHEGVTNAVRRSVRVQDLL